MIQIKWFKSALAASLLTTTVLFPSDLTAQKNGQVTVPDVKREFRGGWIATVGNIDWPSAKTLTPAQQKKELITYLDTLEQLKMNAVILQVRPMADAIFPSKFEPWSEYLTGKQGKAPSPYYDPLQFAVEEAHKRGLELHAWFNPYRAGLSSGKTFAPNHISKTRPDLVRTYGKYLWMDPGEIEVQQHSLNVIMDVVKRYDIDGVHFDDYFYPYKENDAKGKPMDFPDDQSWAKYTKAGGQLKRDDWRRHSVNVFIQRLSQDIKKTKPNVKFGISPFGIWRPGNPAGIAGLDSYSSLYADSRKWLVEGWVDYFAPQLYWDIAAKQQSYPALQTWWVGQNTLKRHIWPGISIARLGPTRPVDEIRNQILLTQKEPGTSGNIHWSSKTLVRNAAMAEVLKKDLYKEPAIIPASPWMSRAVPSKPSLNVKRASEDLKVTWNSMASSQKISVWVVQQRINGKWSTQVLPPQKRSLAVSRAVASAPDLVVVRAVNRFGNISEPAIATIEH